MGSFLHDIDTYHDLLMNTKYHSKQSYCLGGVITLKYMEILSISD